VDKRQIATGQAENRRRTLWNDCGTALERLWKNSPQKSLRRPLNGVKKARKRQLSTLCPDNYNIVST